MKYEINMLSKADMVKGRGVLSAYLEQFSLVNEGLPQFHFAENSLHQYDVTHYHTINFDFYVRRWFRKHKEVGICSVHFLPETVENSLQLPFLIKKVFYWYLIQFYKSMDILVTVNPLFIEMLGKYGIPARKIVYIPNYVSEKDFYPMPAEQKQKRKAAFWCCQWDSCKLVRALWSLLNWQGICRSITLLGQATLPSAKSARDKSKLSRQCRIYRRMSAFWAWFPESE